MGKDWVWGDLLPELIYYVAGWIVSFCILFFGNDVSAIKSVIVTLTLGSLVLMFLKTVLPLVLEILE